MQNVELPGLPVGYGVHMRTVLCDISAFEFWRTPPCVLRIADNALDLSVPADRQALHAVPRFLGGVRVPLHVLVFERNGLHRARSLVRHLWSGELPAGSVVDIDGYHAVTSPEMTLLLMARHLSLPHLLLAMYELTGSYAEVRLAGRERQEIQRFIDGAGWRGGDGWRPVLTGGGALTGLWMRDPLTTAERLQRFADRVGGARGIARFRRALSLLAGSASSPFEAKTAMLMGLPRRLGGYGVGPLSLNRPVAFDRAARIVSGKSRAFVDLYLEPTRRLAALGVECQGRVVHGPGGVNEGDADRLLALERMGLPTVLVTYRQVCEADRFRELMRLISEKRGGRLREKSARQQGAERDLRYELFQGWGELWRENRPM